MTTKYTISGEGPDGDRVPVQRSAWVAWRSSAGGAVEFRGVFASLEDAKADPAVASPATGWQVAPCPLVAWNAIALRGGKG